jgi:hypothetical protein
MVKGRPDGYEWWLNEDQSSVWQERHWRDGQFHGIEREWNIRKKLCRGFPKFYLRGEKVTRRAYERACSNDPTLPLFRIADNKPRRRFPAVVARRLSRLHSARQ